MSIETFSEVRFWTAYRFFVEPQHYTLQLCRDQPSDRFETPVPAAQWTLIQESFSDATSPARKLDAAGVPWETRIKQHRAARKITSLEDIIGAAYEGKDKVDSLRQASESASCDQAEAYKEIAICKAKNRIDQETGRSLRWLRDPEVRKGIEFACKTEDEVFFKRLGRILNGEEAEPCITGLNHIETLLMNNWFNTGLPLAIFSDEALAGLCTCVAEQIGLKREFDSGTIARRRADYKLQNLGSIFSRKAKLGIDQAVGPIIKDVHGTGRIKALKLKGKQVEVQELIALDTVGSAGRS